MNRKVVVLFPGGKGTENPLLYFSAKGYADNGYEKIFVSHPISGEKDFEALYQNARAKVEGLGLDENDEVIFIAKSIGTVVACKLKEECNLPASLVLYTPLQETLPYLHKDNQILFVAAGDTDRYLDTNVLKETCEKEELHYYIEPKVGHRMEVKDDLDRNLEIIGNVIRKFQSERFKNEF